MFQLILILLDFNLLEKSSKKFIGTYDFSNFTNKGVKNPIRTILNIKISKVNISNQIPLENINLKGIYENLSPEDIGLLNNKEDFSNTPVFIDIWGESFLWNMVRKIVRVLLDVNRGILDLNDIDYFLDSIGDKRPVIKLANPSQLILMDVKYNNIKFYYDEYAIMRFSKTIIRNLINYKREYAISRSLLDSLNHFDK